MRIIANLCGVLWICVFLLLSSIASAQPLMVATPPITNLVEPDGDGVYQRLLERALERVDMPVEQVFYPYRRSIRAFEKGEVDCLLSLTDVVEQRFVQDELIYSYPLGKFRFHIFTSEDEAPIESVSDLEGLEVGIIMGHETYLLPVLPQGLSLQAVRTDAHAVRMLNMGRFDAIIAAVPDIKPFVEALSYSAEHSVLEGFDRLNCHNNPRNRAFLEQLSEALIALNAEGVYEQEAGDLYVPLSIEEPPILNER